MLTGEQQQAFAFEIAKEIMKREANYLADQPDRLAKIMAKAYDVALSELKQKAEKEANDFSVDAIMNNAAELPDDFDSAARFK